MASEIKSLLDQLDTVRKEKHVVEEARAKGAKDRDMRVRWAFISFFVATSCRYSDKNVF